MAENKRAFLSTVPGVITGVAGMLTGRRLDPGADCAVDVKLSASAPGSFTASLVITPSPGDDVVVPITGSRLL